MNFHQQTKNNKKGEKKMVLQKHVIMGSLISKEENSFLKKNRKIEKEPII